MGPLVPQILYSAAVFGSLYLAVRRGASALLYAYVFFVPWYGLQLNLGLTLNVDRVLAAALIVFTLVKRGSRGFAGFGLFCAYAALTTIALSVSLPESAREFPALQGEWRWAFQLVMWSLMILPGCIIGATGSGDVVRGCLKALLASAGILAVLAIVQTAIYYGTGFDLFPLGMFEASGEVRSGMFQQGGQGFIGGANVFRASALGGEPKHLGYSLVIALSVIVAEWVYGGILQIRRVWLVMLTVLCGVALVLTFSTQGLGLIAINSTLIAASGVLSGRLSWKRFRLVLVGVGAAVAVLAGIPGLSDVLWLRTVDRLQDTGGVEDWNIAVAQWLADTPSALPFGVGLGNVHLYAAPYIPADYLYYMAGKVFVAKAGALRLVSETGLVGLALFLLNYLAPVRRLHRVGDRSDGLASALPVMALVVLADFLVTTDGPLFILLFGGMSLALARESGRARGAGRHGSKAVLNNQRLVEVSK